jgi:hypothetical protein
LERLQLDLDVGLVVPGDQVARIHSERLADVRARNVGFKSEGAVRQLVDRDVPRARHGDRPYFDKSVILTSDRAAIPGAANTCGKMNMARRRPSSPATKARAPLGCATLNLASGDVYRSLHERMDFAMVWHRTAGVENVGKGFAGLYMTAVKFAIIRSGRMVHRHLVGPFYGVAFCDLDARGNELHLIDVNLVRLCHIVFTFL